MRINCAFFVTLATLSACDPARDERPAPPVAAAATAPVQQGRFYPARMLNDLVPPASDSVMRMRERAKGVVVPTYTGSAPEELTVLNDTAHEVQTVARVRFYTQPDGGWTDTVWTREPRLHAQITRATHEDYGLPVISRHGEWLRVHYAYGADGGPRAGWVRLVSGKTAFHDWDQQLFDFSTSLADSEAAEFYAAPNGQRVQVNLQPSHTLSVLRVAGDWIQVVLMRPDTSACTGNEKLMVQQRDTVWVRRFNAQGMRQLQSASAGC